MPSPLHSSPCRAAFVVALASLAACIDPVHIDAVAQLGPEAPGVVPGPTHRPGRPCTTCHGGEGPGEPDFAFAGTVYTVRGSSAPFEGAVVTVTDATGAQRTARSNEVGSFYVTRREWSPVFPLRVVVEGGGAKKEMVTTMGRDGGCNTCHRGDGDTSFIPRVFLRDK